jgi:hypothetical protein
MEVVQGNGLDLAELAQLIGCCLEFAGTEWVQHRGAMVGSSDALVGCTSALFEHDRATIEWLHIVRQQFEARGAALEPLPADIKFVRGHRRNRRFFLNHRLFLPTQSEVLRLALLVSRPHSLPLCTVYQCSG